MTPTMQHNSTPPWLKHADSRTACLPVTSALQPEREAVSEPMTFLNDMAAEQSRELTALGLVTMTPEELSDRGSLGGHLSQAHLLSPSQQRRRRSFESSATGSSVEQQQQQPHTSRSCLLLSVSAPGSLQAGPTRSPSSHSLCCQDDNDHAAATTSQLHIMQDNLPHALCPEQHAWDEDAQLWYSAACASQCSSRPSLAGCDDSEWDMWAPPIRPAMPHTATAGQSSLPAASNLGQDIKMVWPVCLPLGTGLHVNSRMSVVVDDDVPTPAQDTQAAASDQPQGPAQQRRRNSMVLVMAGASMELLARAPVDQGTALCSVPTSRAFSVSGAALFNQLQAGVGLPMRVLTLFATSGAPGNAVGGDAGPAVTALCAPPRVAEELNLLFCRIAADLLTLETDPSLAHLQMRDVHGFTYLPGTASSSSATAAAAAAAAAPGAVTAATPSDAFTLCPGDGASSAELQARIHQGLSSRFCAAAASKAGADIQLSSQELRVCWHAWATHFQPLMQHVSYLLTCVPSAFAAQLEGCPAWDQHTYCKTLAGMIAFLEHYHCWHTLAGLLQHASAIGVAFRYKGESISRESISAPLLEQLMRFALHDDISVQYLQQAPQRPFDWQPQHGSPAGAGWQPGCLPVAEGPADRNVYLESLGAGLSTLGLTSMCFESVDEVLQSGTDALDFEGILAGEFKDWEERWLVRGYSGTMISSMPSAPAPLAAPAPESAAQTAPATRSWVTVLPWEVIALLLSCIAVAVQYARQMWGL